MEEVGAKCEICNSIETLKFLIFLHFFFCLTKKENLLYMPVYVNATFYCKKSAYLHCRKTRNNHSCRWPTRARDASRIEATNYSINLIACNFKGSIYQSGGGKATFLKNLYFRNLSLADNCLTFFCHSLVIAEP